ncbi:CaiB/BaiF CoA transferase family protein [Tianweitania sediminis]|nr:CaiB/BaiF CoA-transferase family protein [Tianweitania sediminis]
MMPGALSGVTVLDFSTLLPGPMATLFLAEAGADVIKVERPGRGEEMRSYEPKWGSDSINFAMLNRGKKSIAVDLKDPASRERLRPLIEKADIVVEQFRPGVMARLGLGYDDIREVRPDVIYCSITGYGQTGPRAAQAGHDLNYIGDTGLLALSCGTTESPVVPPALIADIAGGSYPAVLNILLALRQRDKTGSGAYLDVAMADNLFPFMYWAFGQGQATGTWPGNSDAQVSGGSPRYRLYATADGHFVAVAPLEQKFWLAFCAAIGLEQELVDDTVSPERTTRRISEIIAARTARELQPVLAAADCCCSIVRSLNDAMADPHFAQRGLFARPLTNDHGQEMAALPTPIAASARGEGTAASRAPRLGEHTRELLGPEAE